MVKKPKHYVQNEIVHHRHALDAIDAIADDIYDLARTCEDGDWTRLEFNPRDKQEWYDMYDLIDYVSRYLHIMSSLAQNKIKEKQESENGQIGPDTSEDRSF